jgi:hypothetical protein
VRGVDGVLEPIEPGRRWNTAGKEDGSPIAVCARQPDLRQERQHGWRGRSERVRVGKTGAGVRLAYDKRQRIAGLD